MSAAQKDGDAATAEGPGSGDVRRGFYEAVVKRDFTTARRFLGDDLVFVGLFETYPSADAYLSALTMLMGITARLDVRAVIAEGRDVAVFFELETPAPAQATAPGGEWHPVRDGKDVHVQTAVCRRPVPPMFLRGEG